MICFWCNNESECLTDDHIVPQSLGGTLEHKVSSCGLCQTRLSKAELEVARKSILAIHALSSAVKPRHRNRPTSGNLQPTYLLVKTPSGSYRESLLSAGDKVRSLAYFEVKVVPGEPIEARVRGGKPEEARLLLDLFRKALQAKAATGKPVCDYTANLKLDPEIVADKDFWPRIVLLPGNRLLCRARSPDELLRFAKAFTAIALSDYQVDPSRWTYGPPIAAGTIHKVALEYDPQCVRRVAAKIAYGMLLTLTNGRMPSEEDQRMRHYILGTEDSEDEPVSITSDPVTSSTSDAPHFIVLSPDHDKYAGIVSLYGSMFRVELRIGSALPRPLAVVCEIDGSGMRIATHIDTTTLSALIKNVSFSRPWLTQIHT